MIKNMVDVFAWELALRRRIGKNWIAPKKQKKWQKHKTNKKGLYPSTIIPKYLLGKIVMVIPDEINAFGGETIKGFKIKVTEKWIIPRKSRSYYTGSEWIKNDKSDKGLYPCIIVPKELIGKLVDIVPIIEK